MATCDYIYEGKHYLAVYGGSGKRKDEYLKDLYT
jgi:hypothetical protein